MRLIYIFIAALNSGGFEEQRVMIIIIPFHVAIEVGSPCVGVAEGASQGQESMFPIGKVIACGLGYAAS